MKRAILLVVVALVLVAGCGPSPAPTLTPAEVAQAAATKMAAVNSFHFLIQVSGKAAYLDSAMSMALKSAEGDLVRPDRVRVVAKVGAMGMTSEIGLIGIGDKQYATNPLNQQWQEVAPESRWQLDLAALFDAENGIPAMLQGTTWTLGAGDATTYVLTARMPYTQLRSLGFGLIVSGDVQVELRVGRDDQYVQRIQIVEVESDAQSPTTWVIELSAFDKPVDIQAPPLP